MTKYRVKVYASTGERIDFISNDVDDSPFGELADHEYLYFNFKDHQDLFEILAAEGGYTSWYFMSLWLMWDEWVNFTVHNVRDVAAEYIGLPREDASRLALEQEVSFRVVLEDGMQMIDDFSFKDNRVSVYLDQDVVYQAEWF